MGIEHSSYQTANQPRQSVTGAIPRAKLRTDATASGESGRSSPHPSLCSSDVDVPYVSYTVNKPIGDSPKHHGKSTPKQLRGHLNTITQSKPIKGRNIVVVSQKATTDVGDDDSEIKTIQEIPLFLPIIRSSLSTTHPREPDIVDRLNTGALQRIVAHLQDYMKQNAEAVASEQVQLAQSIKDIDSQINLIMNALTERQKMYARYAERLSRVHEVSHSLSRCQLALMTALDSIETLNRQLPDDDKLEPFLWSTG